MICWCFRTLLAWFPRTLGSRQMIWIILLRMFFDFGVEVHEVLEGFWGLIFAELFHFWILVPLNVSGRLLFIGVWGWVSDTWRSLIGDTCHSLISPLKPSLTSARLPVPSLTRVKLFVSLLTRALMCDWFLHDTWQISVGFWIVIAKPNSSMWCFVIDCILWTW